MSKLEKLINYLEWKVVSNEYGEEEYGLYMDYVWNGSWVFKEEIHRELVRYLLKEIKYAEKEGYVE